MSKQAKRGSPGKDKDGDLSRPVFSTETGDLRKSGLGGSLLGASVGARPPSAPVKPAKPDVSRKLTVRLERKGRGGKTVTLVENYRGPGPSKEDLAKSLKAQCGTGGSLEPDGSILIQGDQRERVAAYLGKLGLKPSISGG